MVFFDDIRCFFCSPSLFILFSLLWHSCVSHLSLTVSPRIIPGSMPAERIPVTSPCTCPLSACHRFCLLERVSSATFMCTPPPTGVRDIVSCCGFLAFSLPDHFFPLFCYARPSPLLRLPGCSRLYSLERVCADARRFLSSHFFSADIAFFDLDVRAVLPFLCAYSPRCSHVFSCFWALTPLFPPASDFVREGSDRLCT